MQIVKVLFGHFFWLHRPFWIHLPIDVGSRPRVRQTIMSMFIAPVVIIEIGSLPQLLPLVRCLVEAFWIRIRFANGLGKFQHQIMIFFSGINFDAICFQKTIIKIALIVPDYHIGLVKNLLHLTSPGLKCWAVLHALWSDSIDGGRLWPLVLFRWFEQFVKQFIAIAIND